MRKMSFLVGAGVGYVLGAKAGRERFDQICSLYGKVRENPQVQQATETIATKGGAMAHTVADKAAEKAPDWVPGSRGPDAATGGPDAATVSSGVGTNGITPGAYNRN